MGWGLAGVCLRGFPFLERGLTKINDKLDDLKTGDPLLPPDADAARALEVVPVHDDVNHQVERDRDPGDGGEADELGVAEESSRAVVVAVEEGCSGLALAWVCGIWPPTQWLLLQDQEDGIDQFEVLGEVVELYLLVMHPLYCFDETYVV